MNKKINIVVAGDSSFSWYLVNELKTQVTGRLYFILEDKDQAIEASLLENVIAITGDITDTKVLDQLELAQCHTVVIGSKEERTNIMAALYAKKEGAHNVYARVFEEKVSKSARIPGGKADHHRRYRSILLGSADPAALGIAHRQFDGRRLFHGGNRGRPIPRIDRPPPG